MKKIKNIITIILITILIVSCGETNPVITQFKVKSDRLGVLLDTKDGATISDLSKYFYEKEEKPDASPDFRFFIDLKFGDRSERWQYSIDGFIRNFDEGYTTIYQVRDVIGFNRAAKIR